MSANVFVWGIGLLIKHQSLAVERLIKLAINSIMNSIANAELMDSILAGPKMGH